MCEILSILALCEVLKRVSFGLHLEGGVLLLYSLPYTDYHLLLSKVFLMHFITSSVLLDGVIVRIIHGYCSPAHAEAFRFNCHFLKFQVQLSVCF